MSSSGIKPKHTNAKQRSTAIQKAVSESDSIELDEIDDSDDTDDSPKLKKKLHESRRVVFILGAFLGLVAAVFFTTSNTNLKSELDRYVNFDSLNLFEDWNAWTDILPLGFQALISDIPKQRELQGSAESFAVGKQLKSKYNLEPKYNVVLVPGVISTGIESWSVTTDGDCPSINHFRKRLWGSFYMLRTMVLDKTCWLKHIMLDQESGLDPEGVTLRAAQGFEAADFFLAGYWIWNKVLQNLAVVGYGPNNMVSAAYDWRLAFLDLERRDGYFSKLKLNIELNKRLTGEKSILVGHSMGSQVVFYFMKWVEAEGELYGNGGPSWVNDHIDSFVDVSGSSLGTPKTITALLSGEMRDTVQLNALAVYGLEKFFSKKERVDMLQSFGGIASMIPKGGDVIWGNLTHAPDDPTNTLETGNKVIITQGDKSQSFGTFIRFDDKNLTLDRSIEVLLEQSPDWYSKRVNEQYSFGIEKSIEQLKINNNDHSKWSNPLEAALPYAPDMNIYCFYGVGKATERAYTYTKAHESTNLKMVIDSDLKDPVFLGDGDGTVSLLTHSICHEWKKGSQSRFNPGNSKVTIVEIKDEPDRFDLRGGAKTADHVDILGCAELNELILNVASGRGDSIEDRYVSNLREMVSKMDI